MKNMQPDMKLDKQVRKATGQIRQMLSDMSELSDDNLTLKYKARYALDLLDQMVNSAVNGIPRPWSEYSPMIDEEFSELDVHCGVCNSYHSEPICEE